MTDLTTSLHTNTMCDLTHLGLLEISGADAYGFLQGQVSNDVNLLNGNIAQYNAYCTPKGRMLALFLAFAHDNRIYLQLPKTLLEPIAKRLRMYVLRSKVVIQDVSDTFDCIGIHGAGTAQILASNLGQVPNADFAMQSYAHAMCIKLPSVHGLRFQIVAPKAESAALKNRLQDTLHQINSASAETYWDWLEIQAGLPQIYPQTQEQFVPQMLNLDILNGINFKKGCYTGQEIVARTHYLGTVKRRTFLASISPASPLESAPQAGDKLLDASQNEVGQIVRIAPNTENGVDVLAELRIDAQQAGNISCHGLPLVFKGLPYPLEN